MLKLDLAGTWQMRETRTDNWIEGALPGCQYLDLQAAGEIKNPFWGINEKTASKLAENSYTYRRVFQVSEKMLACDQIELTMEGVDTFANISINGKPLAQTDSAFRSWRIPCKEYLTPAENEITIIFDSPLPHIAQAQEKRPVPFNSSFGLQGIQQIRKPQYHFGWDWGPVLPPAGISGSIELQGFTLAKIAQVSTTQHHVNGQVRLAVEAEIISFCNTPLTAEVRLKTPDSKTLGKKGEAINGIFTTEIIVDEPALWWCNGLGSQPLYALEVNLLAAEGLDKPLDTWQRRIGLRTVALNTGQDEWGHNFQFMINGVPIFAKGADWIPSDSFVARTTYEDLAFYIDGAARANMNMLRVWGGGYYESDMFYDLCDEYGILVWQDFCFACLTYPFYDDDFLNALTPEAENNVKRLRHHASLALWCGNNEIQVLSDIMNKKNPQYKKAEKDFFYEKLPALVRQWDDATPYWPGSPTGGTPDAKANGLNAGDTHLWQVWHGLQPLSAFRRYPTRFCSEYGMESFPSEKTLLTFTDDPTLDIFDPVMLAHQKSHNGNEKMLFYILSRYPNPAATRDFSYLSQLIQSETIRRATEGWRRKMGRCNGSLYWQYNDCWPTASWAGIDYEKQYKAVQYKARHFNAMLNASADIRGGHADLYAVNDYPSPSDVMLKWQIKDLDGQTVAKGEKPADLLPHTAQKIETLHYKPLLRGKRKKDVYLLIELTRQGQVVGLQTHFLVPDKKVRLQTGTVQREVRMQASQATMLLTSPVFMRHVFLDMPGAAGPLSDNFFDLEPGIPKEITFTAQPGITWEQLERFLKVRSLADVKSKGNRLNDWFIRARIFLKPRNLLMWFLFRFAV